MVQSIQTVFNVKTTAWNTAKWFTVREFHEKISIMEGDNFLMVSFTTFYET